MIGAATDAASDTPGDYVNAEVIAAALGKPVSYLVKRSLKGDFAPMIRLSERVYAIRRKDLVEWERRAEVSPATAGVHRGFLDTTPAEPFSELESVATPSRSRSSPKAAVAASSGSRAATRGRSTDSPRRRGGRA